MNPTPTQPAPEVDPKPHVSGRVWALIVLLVLLAGGGMIYNWNWQMRGERARLTERLAAIPTLDREALEAAWLNRDGLPNVSWTPDPQADPVLAVMPRAPHMKVDAIYALYRGHRATAILAISPIGGWFGDQRIDIRQHPETMVARPLDAIEQAELDTMIGLIEARRDRFDPESKEYGWTDHVLNQARRLRELQP